MTTHHVRHLFMLLATGILLFSSFGAHPAQAAIQ